MEPRSTRIGPASSLAAVGERSGAPAEVGSVLAARVVARESASRYVLQVGRERWNVSSEKPLVVGDRLQVTVEDVGGRLALRALEAEPGGSSGMLRWLLARTGSRLTLGDAVQELGARLSRSNPELAQRLNAILRAASVEGPLTGSELAARFARSGARFESLLQALAEARSGGGARSVETTVPGLLARLLGGAESVPSALRVFGSLFESALRNAMEALRTPGGAGESAHRFARALSADLVARLARVEAPDADAVRLREQLVQALRTRPTQLAYLRPRLLHLLTGGGPLPSEALATALRENLKTRLLQERSLLNGSSEAEPITRVLESIEQEQLRQVVRGERGEEREWTSLLYSDGRPTPLRIRRRHARASEKSPVTSATPCTPSSRSSVRFAST